MKEVGYDNNADDDIDDAGDDLVVNDAFDATTVGFTYDDNGNLTDDGTYKYTYDAWNRLVKVTASSDTDIVIQTARFDGLGRRVRKVVTNSGELDGTTVYYHNGNQIIETRNGSGDLVRQMVHGTQYIDELVGLRIADLGRFYVHQDANYNVVALSDMSGRFVERTYYSPYGQPEFVLDAHPFDYDDDGDVDASDIAAATTGGDCWGSYTGQGGACKRLDADADRDIDADDHAAIVNYVNALPVGGELQRTPSSPKSTLRNAFAHQGLLLDPEIGSYQNRARQYALGLRRFTQRDPLGPKKMPNTFLYVLSNPQRFRDSTGMITDEEATQICEQHAQIGRTPGLGETLCDGNGGFVLCHIGADGKMKGNGKTCGQGGSPTDNPCPSPPAPLPPGCEGPADCANSEAACSCAHENSHVDDTCNVIPNACSPAAGATRGGPPGVFPGQRGECYKFWEHIRAMQKQIDCLAQSQCKSARDRVKRDIQDAKNTYQSECSDYADPGSDWQ